jgi:hypothetical protein
LFEATMVRPFPTIAALTLLAGVSFWAASGIATPDRAAAADPRDTAQTADFDPVPKRHRVRYPRKGPPNYGVLSNTCDHFPCGSWPSYYDMPPPIRPRVFYGYEPHRLGWPGDRRGWYRWDW